MAKPGPGPLDLNVGARIRLRRKALGITQSELAQALGLTFQQVQKYERGVNRVSASVLVKIAQRLDCPVSYLLGEEGGGAAEAIAPSIMVTPGAVELLEVYSKIPDRRARAALLSVARALACDDVAEAEDEADAA
ncbi:MAG: helix-turn-helix domain-containing protein [Ignavibacteriales bacterium]